MEEKRPEKQSEEQFRSLIENAMDLVTVLETDGSIRYQSPSVERVLGFTPEELVGKSVFDFIHPEDVQNVRKIFEEAVSIVEASRVVDFRIRDKNGSWHFLESIGKNLSFHPLVRGVIINSRDITERKQAEELLYESELSYRTLAENLPGIVYRVLIRENSRVKFLNKMSQALTGYKDEELKDGEVCSIESLILEKDRPKVVAEVKRSISEDRPFTIEYRLRHKNGSIRYFLEKGTPIYGKDGNPLYIDGVIFDITERKQTEEAIKKLNEELKRNLTQLEAANERLEAFSYSVSHELRTQLRHLSEYAELLSREVAGTLNQKSYYYLNVLLDSSKYMSELIDDLLAFIQTESLKTQVSLDEIAKRSCLMSQKMIRGTSF